MDSTAIADRLLKELRELDDPEQDNVCFSVIKVAFQQEADDGANIFATDFENRPRRKRQVTTRPIKPRPPAPEEAAAFPASMEEAKSTMRRAPEAESEPARDRNPVFLRRRWLATDGGGA